MFVRMCAGLIDYHRQFGLKEEAHNDEGGESQHVEAAEILEPAASEPLRLLGEEEGDDHQRNPDKGDDGRYVPQREWIAVQAHENEGDRDKAHGVKTYLGAAVEPLVDEGDPLDQESEAEHESEEEEESLKSERFVPKMSGKPERVFELALILDIDIGDAGILYFTQFGGMLGAVALQSGDLEVVAASGEDKSQDQPYCEAWAVVIAAKCR